MHIELESVRLERSPLVLAAPRRAEPIFDAPLRMPVVRPSAALRAAWQEVRRGHVAEQIVWLAVAAASVSVVVLSFVR